MRGWWTIVWAACRGAEDPPAPTCPDCGETPQTTCALQAPGPIAVDPRAECGGGEPVVDPWAFRVEWAFVDGVEAVGAPVVGHLDGDAVPDVAFVSYVDGTLFLLRGGDGAPICSSPGWDLDASVVIADVDGDGANEVVGPASGASEVRAVDGACAEEWQSDERHHMNFGVTTAADLDADGVVEVIADNTVLDGRTGEVRATLTPANDSCWRTPIAADLDQDGQLEVILGNSVFDASGALRWSVAGTGSTCLAAVVDVDDDPDGELILAFGFVLGAYDPDGTPVWTAELAMPNPGPPCAGDLDGDGAVEIVAPNGFFLTAFEADGAVKWEVPIDDTSGAAACSVFDLDGDGAYEVLHADEAAMRVYDGRTGAVRWEDGRHPSVTFFESPTVADVDGDGAAEILVARSSFPLDVEGGVWVYGHDGGGWAAAGPTWGIPDYSGSNQSDDGGIPQHPVAPWLGPGIFRGRPPSASPNLALEVTEVCGGCDGDALQVAVRVWNDSGAASPPTTARLWTDVEVASAPVPRLDVGDSHGLVFSVPGADAGVVRVDAVGDCRDDDDEAPWIAAPCE